MGTMPKEIWLEARIHCLQNGAFRWAVVKHTTIQLLRQVLLQADLPAWAKPYFERNLAKAEAEYGKDYQAYSGERFADQSADTLAAIEGTRDLANQVVMV